MEEDEQGQAMGDTLDDVDDMLMMRILCRWDGDEDKVCT